MSAIPESSGSAQKLEEGAKRWLAPQQTGATTLVGTGTGTGTAVSSSVEVPRPYFAIDDSREPVTKSSPVWVTTYDCIDAVGFWTTLLANKTFFEPVRDQELDAERIVRRQKLLDVLLTGVPRFAVIVLSTEPRKLPIGIWNVATVVLTEEVVTFEGAVAAVAEGKPVFVEAPNLYDDAPLRAAKAFDTMKAEAPDAEILEEIFSLNHVPDAGIEPGGTTGPAEPPPIALSDGGFRFEAPDDLEFWNGCVPYPNDFRMLDESKIEPHGELGKAYCTTGEVFDIFTDDPEVGGSYAVFLVNDQKAFAIELLEPGAEDSPLKVSAVIYAPQLQPDDDVSELLTRKTDSRRYSLSPKKEPSTPPSTPVKKKHMPETPSTPPAQRRARGTPLTPGTPYKPPAQVTPSPSSPEWSEDSPMYSPAPGKTTCRVAASQVWDVENDVPLAMYGLFYRAIEAY